MSTDLPTVRGFYITETVGFAVANPRPVGVWHLTPEQSEAIALAAKEAGMTVDAFIDQFDSLEALVAAGVW